jgi:hypothetical protein
MKRYLIVAAVAFAIFALAPFATAQTPPPAPFPAANTGDVFVSAQTVTTDGAMSNFFAPGSTVVFRAYAVNGKTRKLVTIKTAKYFYVKIPGRAANLKFKYTPRVNGASGRYAWTARWSVPTDYPNGIVAFKVVVQTKPKKHVGAFIQAPVATSQLTITPTPQNPPGSGPSVTPGPGVATVPVALYVDSVNGTRPAGAAPRPIGCTQTNVFKRGEQFVLRAWGSEVATGATLTNDNVTNAHFTVPGVPDILLNWGSHGATGNKVWFWTNFWNIPKDYPLGDTVVRVSFTTMAGKTGVFNYLITIIP